MNPTDTVPPQPNLRPWEIPFSSRGPFLGRISKFSDIYYEVEKKSANGLRIRDFTVQTKMPDVLTRIDIHVTFERLRGRNGLPLELKTKYRASLQPNAKFTKLLADLLGVTPEAIAKPGVELSNVEFDELLGRFVSVTLDANEKGFVRIRTVAAAPLDVLPAGSAPAPATGQGASNVVGADGHRENLVVDPGTPSDVAT